ncbi:MAG: hypothetical protein V3U84_01360 [Thiotrichaceae bacterium]
MVGRVWTLAERLTVGIGLALLALSMILGISGYATLSSLFESNLRERAESQARQLALFSADAILVYDYATLERYSKELSDEPGILSVSIIRSDGEVLAEAGEQENWPPSSTIKVDQSLQLGNSDIGVVQLVVDRQGMEDSLRRLGISGLIVLMVLLIALFWILRKFIDRGLIRPVQQLAQAANPLNNKNCPEPKDLPQELESLAQTFRGLCSDIKTHLHERESAELRVRNATDILTEGEMEERLNQFGLEIAPQKTKILEFGRWAQRRAKARGERKAETFDFLGFTHYCTTSGKTKRFEVGRKSISQRVTAKLKHYKQWLQKHRTLPTAEIMKITAMKLSGHYAYYGVTRL